MTAEVEAIIERLARNPRLLHATLFPHRHGDATPAFHLEMIDAWWSTDPHVGTEAFRGGAKSTIAEEAITGMACLRMFKNAIILGDNETRAKERLTSIKHELETNEDLIELFGDLVGDTWTETKIVLTNGTAYWVEALFKEGTGGDYMEVVMRAVDQDRKSVV